jgi:hypothetical protein
MDPITFRPTPFAPDDDTRLDLAEVDAAIEMVAAGHARRISLVALAHADAIAAIALARAQAADIGFRLERDPGGAVRLTLGPRQGEPH